MTFYFLAKLCKYVISAPVETNEKQKWGKITRTFFKKSEDAVTVNHKNFQLLVFKSKKYNCNV